MFGTLGYIDNGRRPVARDSHFMGTNGHPARRDMYGAVRRSDAQHGSLSESTEANVTALLQRRCAFLEEQEKRRGAEVADLRAKVSHLQAEARAETVVATVLEPTVQTSNVDALDGREVEGGATSVVPAGLDVTLQYPMKRLRSAAGATQVWMRRRQVDPHLAAVSYSWLLLFEEKDGEPDRVLVGSFR